MITISFHVKVHVANPRAHVFLSPDDPDPLPEYLSGLVKNEIKSNLESCGYEADVVIIGHHRRS